MKLSKESIEEIKKVLGLDDESCTKKTSDKIPCLITTDNAKRGVFMGYINPDDADQEIIEAEEIRMAVYWSKDMKGVMGLATMGPSNTCRISKAVPKAIIKGVTAVMELTKEAEKNWKKEPWG